MPERMQVQIEIWKEPLTDRVNVRLLDVNDDKTYSVDSRRNYGSPLLYKALERLLQKGT